MKIDSVVLGYILGALDASAGVIMVAALVRITTTAGWRTPQQRWAQFRRGTYSCISIALWGLGWGRMTGDIPAPTLSEFLFQSMLLYGIMIFPLLRWLGWISQDALLDRPDGRTASR